MEEVEEENRSDLVLSTILPRDEMKKYCEILSIPVDEVNFKSMRNAFRHICLRHHPEMLLYSYKWATPSSTFQSSVVAFAKLAATIIMQDTNALHAKNRNAFDWAGRMISDPPSSASSRFGLSIRPTEPEDIVPTLRCLQDTSNWQNLARASKMLDVFISHSEQVESHTVYVITVIYCMRRHRVKRRYREFLSLHAQLSRIVTSLPSFPPKKWSKNSAGVLSERAAALSLYLQGVAMVLANEGLYSKELHEFLKIDTLRVRREEELQMVELLEQKHPGHEQWYIVDEQWIVQWRAFVQPNADYDPPDRISNERLLHSDGTPKKNMMIITDYRCVHGDVWALWMSIYGGGPAIVRSKKDLHSRPVTSCAQGLLTLQRLAQRFLSLRLKQSTIGHLLASQRQKQRQIQQREIAACEIQKRIRRWLKRKHGGTAAAASGA